MAALCDSLAKDFGEVEETPVNSPGGEMQTLASKAASSAGDCCKPKA